MTWFLMNMVSGSIDRQIDVYFATNYVYMYNNINSNLNEQENRIDWLRVPMQPYGGCLPMGPYTNNTVKNKHNVNIHMDALDYKVLFPYLDTRSDLYHIDSSRNTSN